MDTINYHNAPVLFEDNDKNEYLDKTGFYHLSQSIMKKLNNKLGNSCAGVFRNKKTSNQGLRELGFTASHQ